jgi:hypothetical protein
MSLGSDTRKFTNILSFYERYSGLLLFFGFFIFFAALGEVLSPRNFETKKALSFTALLIAIAAWGLLPSQLREMSKWRRVVVVVGAVALTIEMISKVAGMFITGQDLSNHHWLDYAFMYQLRISLVLRGVAILFTFFGRGRSRLLFIAVLTLMCLVG